MPLQPSTPALPRTYFPPPPTSPTLDLSALNNTHIFFPTLPTPSPKPRNRPLAYSKFAKFFLTPATASSKGVEILADNKAASVDVGRAPDEAGALDEVVVVVAVRGDGVRGERFGRVRYCDA